MTKQLLYFGCDTAEPSELSLDSDRATVCQIIQQHYPDSFSFSPSWPTHLPTQIEGTIINWGKLTRLTNACLHAVRYARLQYLEGRSRRGKPRNHRQRVFAKEIKKAGEAEGLDGWYCHPDRQAVMRTGPGYELTKALWDGLVTPGFRARAEKLEARITWLSEELRGWRWQERQEPEKKKKKIKARFPTNRAIAEILLRQAQGEQNLEKRHALEQQSQVVRRLDEKLREERAHLKKQVRKMKEAQPFSYDMFRQREK